ncbi:MAG: Ig-like domain-containing protein [Verrucomicrobia bacterium]|nr:Ig-like domain-containing protein [Verrucomicrobiota bacterium]
MKTSVGKFLVTTCLAAGAGLWAVQAAAPATPQGSITAKTFQNIGGGTAVADLTGNAKFPNRPDTVTYPPYFELHATGDINTPPANDVLNNYGAQMVGYFYPDVTGDYVFYLSADDNAVLYLSTDDTPANKKLIAQETGWSNPRSYLSVGAGSLESKDSSTFTGTEWPTRDPVNGGARITLNRGRAYYIEALMKEGGGGDNLSVSIDSVSPIDGAYLSPYVTASGPTILAQPQNAYVYVGGTATFSVGFDIPPPATLTSITWQKNGADIPDSNAATVSLVATAGDNGAKVKAIITTSAGTLTSEEATLTVATLSNEFTPGVVKFEAYHDIGGTAVQALLDDPKYPNSPDNLLLLGSLSTPNGYRDNYGARVTGFIIPPESGQYRFFLYSDDASALYLSNNQTLPNPDLVDPICQETDCCDVFQEPGVPNDDGFTYPTSEPISLTAGQRYAFLALVKEGGGGDYLQIAVRKEGSTTPAASLQPIAGSWIGANAKPNLGTPVITQQPQGIPRLLQGRKGELAVAAVVNPTAYNFPYSVQWQKDGAPIPGANGTVYTIPAASAADGGTYAAVITAPSGETVTSANAEVTYVPDTFPPKISKVKASSVSSLIVTFDEPLDAASAGAVANYSLSDGVAVTAATPSGTSVLLNTGGLKVGSTYTLTVSGVRDPYGNVVPAGTSSQFVVNVVTYADVILADGPVMFYRFEETSGQKTVNLGTAGPAADGLWKSGQGPDDSVAINVSPGVGPRPGEFLGFAPDNRSGKFTGPEGLEWVDAQLQLLNNLGAFTLEYWVKPKNRASDPAAFGNRIGIVGQNDAVEYGFINPNTIQIWTPGGGALDTPYSFPDETWHHVATIADGTSIKNYFDGKFINQITQNTANYGSSIYSVHVGGGGAFDATGNHFTGEIDEVAIFNKAIPAARIAAHYDAGKIGGEVPVSANIAWVSFHPADNQPSTDAAAAGFTEAPDVGYTRLLTQAGHKVTRIVTSGTPDVARLNTFDLVIISRSVPSGDYQDPPETLAWNGVKAPMMILGGYVMRNSRLGFTKGGTIPDTIGPVRLSVKDITHPIFTGVNLGAGSVTVNPYADVVTWNDLLQRGISVNTDPLAGNGVILASIVAEGDPANGGTVIAEWEAGDTMANGAADKLGGHRLVFLTGSREQGITSQAAGIYDLTDDGARMFLNAVQYMAQAPVVLPEFAPVILSGGNITLSWTGQGTLEEATSVSGPWTPAANQANPQTVSASTGVKFYRLKR